MQRDFEKDMQHYDSEIAELHSRLLYLEEKKKMLNRHAERLKSLSAPIRRLPVELLTRIFVFFCDGRYITVARHAFPFIYPPFALASVCRGWRQIAIDTSCLWSRTLELIPIAQTAIPRFEAPLRLCIARSRSHPLSVKLHVGGEGNGLVPLLIEQSSRWQSVEIDNRFGLDLSNIRGRTFPLLETLKLTYIFPDLHIFNTAPQLHSLWVHSLPPAQVLIHFTPRSQITSLQAFCCHDDSDLNDSVFQALEMFPNLQSMVYASLNHYIPRAITPQTLPRLSSVEFRVGYQYLSLTHNLLQALVDKLSLPSLTNLTITSACGVGSESWTFRGIWPSQTFADFFQRSGCSLQSLHLDYISLSDQDLTVLLMLNPSLVELRVKEIRRKDYNFARYRRLNGTVFQFRDIITPALLISLHACDHGVALSSPLVPKLERLHLVADGNLFDDELFWKLIVSRWIPEEEYAQTIGVCSLRSVKICGLGRALWEDVELKLRRLERVGLELFVRTGEEEDNEV